MRSHLFNPHIEFPRASCPSAAPPALVYRAALKGWEGGYLKTLKIILTFLFFYKAGHKTYFDLYSFTKNLLSYEIDLFGSTLKSLVLFKY